ncbi:MAG: extracellular solute-binding protein, partial [Candidatus Gallimonas sp.]
MKKLKRFVVLAVAMNVLCTGLLTTACGKTTVRNEETDLVIQMYLGGYGVDGMNAVARRFEEINVEKGYTVTITPNASMVYKGVYDQIRLGPVLETSDMFIAGLNYKAIVYEGDRFVHQDWSGECALEDLTDVYNSKVYGEEVLFKDKINPSYRDNSMMNGKYYAANWASGVAGVMYNKTHFGDNGWTEPVTTDELNELCAKMKTAGYTPFQWASGASYWEYLAIAWWRQLVPDQEAVDFYNCIDQYGEESAEVFKSYARLKAYSLVHDYVSVQSGNSASDAITTSHTQSQMALMMDKKKVCMMPTGDWAEQEMKNIGITGNIGMFKVPVASDVIYVDGDASTYKFDTVRSESKLREVIHAIDNNAEKPAAVSQEDFDALKKIRSYNGTEGYSHQIVIPAFSNAKELAKEFLLFLASDEALQIYFDTTGCTLPFLSDNLDTSAGTQYQKDTAKIGQASIYVNDMQS